MIYLRSLLFNAAFFAWSTLCVFAFIPLLPLPRPITARALRLWAKAVGWMLAHLTKITAEVRGRENLPEGPVLIVSKHQSAWETVMYHDVLESPAFVVKKELMSIPLYGWFILKSGSFMIDREGGARALKRLLRDAAKVAARGQPLVIFPEGTRTAPGRQVPFQPGVAALYSRLGVPVVPAALNSGLFWGRRSFLKRPGRIVVEFLPAISPGLDRKRFLAEIESRIETACAALEAEIPVENSVDNLQEGRRDGL